MDQVHFYGHSGRIEGGRALWQGVEEALMMAYDVVILVYTTSKNTNSLRL